jgi:hypothetical protein
VNDTLDLLMSTARERRHASSAFRREYHPTAEQSQEIIERLYSSQSEATTLAPELPAISLPPAYDDEPESDDVDAGLDQEGIAADDPVRIYLREIGRVSLLTAQ